MSLRSLFCLSRVAVLHRFYCPILLNLKQSSETEIQCNVVILTCDHKNFLNYRVIIEIIEKALPPTHHVYTDRLWANSYFSGSLAI